ncbi:MAG: hypothetical protein ACRYFS_18830, partial [Janthinobacterium lividum]
MTFGSFLRLCIAAAVLTGGSNAVQAQQSTTHATITINATKTLGPVNRLVFGDNIEAADPRHLYEGVPIFPALHTGNGFWDDQARRPVPYVVQHMKEVGL